MDLINFFLHIDKHLQTLIQTYGVWSYAILFAVIFMETGVVVTPFLPGDSLLFAAGSLAALGSFNIWLLFIMLLIAAIIGDSVNYWIGNKIGPKLLESQNPFLKKILKKEYIDKTHAYFEKYGGKTIIIGRFIPIVRTFAPFVAGIGSMTYKNFIIYNILGGFLWVSIFTLGGFFFGNIPIVKNNFSIVIMVIILISILPGVYEYIKHKFNK